MGKSTRWMWVIALVLIAGACGKEETPPPPQAPAVPAATAQPTAPPGSPGAPGAGMPAVPGQVAPGLPPGIPNMAGMAEAMKAVQQLQQGQQQLGPAVNWRKLAEFVPERLGDHAASAELDGETTEMGGFHISKASRKYAAGERRVELTITDASLVPQLRAPFAMMQMMNEDSSRGFKRGKTIGGQPGWVEWRVQGGRSEATVLAGGRFIVKLEIRGASDPNQAETLLGTINLSELAALTAE